MFLFLLLHIFSLWHFFCLFLSLLGLYLWHMEVPRLRGNQSCSCQPTAKPQQHEIWASCVTYTTAHGNAGSLTHWVRPGIEPVSSWMLVRSANRSAMTGTPWGGFFVCFFSFGLVFRAIPVAYGSSQASGRIWAAAASLCHRHSNARSEPRLQPTPQLQQLRILNLCWLG